MDKIFFTDWQSIVRILIISITAYLSLIIILRVSGKRTLSKMNAFDFIVTIALGSTLATVILNKNVSLADGVLTFALLTFLQYLITHFSYKKKQVSNLVKSTPALIAYKGKLVESNMKKERIVEEEVWAALRERGFSSLEEIEAVVLENEGSLSVIKQIQDPTAPPVKKLIQELNDPHS